MATTTTPPSTEEPAKAAVTESTTAPPPPTTTTDNDEKAAEPSAAPKSEEAKPAEKAVDAPVAADKEESGSGPIPQANDDDDSVNPPDFQGEVLSNDDLPSLETIRRIGDYIVLDRHGKTHPFRSLYTGRNVARRVLVVFVRHFFCGNCQEYLRALSASITPKALLQLPIPTFIAVVGCGDPALIDMYASETGCPYPIYADPTRKLYQELGMVKTLALGTRPAYAQKSLLKSSLDSIVQGLKQIKSGLAVKGGDQRQIGGEFLFEPTSLQGPDASPVQEFDRRLRLADAPTDGDDKKEEAGLGEGEKGSGEARLSAENAAASKHSRSHSLTDNDNDEVEEPGLVEEKKVTWCHRMRTTRDHVEVPELMEVLGLTGVGKPIKDQKRWSKALGTRKGTGLSMASQMSQMAQQKEAQKDTDDSS